MQDQVETFGFLLFIDTETNQAVDNLEQNPAANECESKGHHDAKHLDVELPAYTVNTV